MIKMGIDRRIVSSEKIEALVDDTLKALKVKTWPASTADLDTLEATLTNLEKALQSINTDYLKVQHRDGAGNLMPSMDVAARKGFVAVTDGTDVLDIIGDGDAASGLKGTLMLGLRYEGADTARPIPVAFGSDSISGKATSIVPITAITQERTEGVRIHTNDVCFSVSFGVDDISTKTGYVLIDLSDATNYPHTLTTEIHIDWISIVIHGNATSTGQIHVGFISAIDADKGTLHVVAGLVISKLETITHMHRLFAPSAVRCKLAAHLSGGTELHTDDTTFQNDTALTATYATATPAVGDLCIIVDVSAGTFEHSSVSVGYHTI